NSPTIIGSAEAGSTVKLYTNSTCTSAVAASGTAATFASPGIPVSVSNNTTTTYFATATDAAVNVSPCSASSVTYVEDSTAPAAPANNNAPKIIGSAEAGSTVKLYTGATCPDGAAATGTAAAFASPGLTVAVADDSTTSFYATATDAAGNVSACSSSSVTYVEDSTPPNTTLDSTPTNPSNVTSPTFTFSSSETGSTFQCRLDASPGDPFT